MIPDTRDVLYGRLGLLVLKTLEALGPLHGYRIARRIEQISGNQLALNQGTLYPALLKLEQALHRREARRALRNPLRPPPSEVSGSDR